MNTNGEPPILPGCSVLSPMEIRPDDELPGKPKGRPSRREAGDRFATFNAFVDFTMLDLTRAEALVWLALYCDTKRDGLARTSQANMARRVGANVCTIKRAVAALRGRGLLTVVFRAGLRPGPSAYRVHPLTEDRVKGAWVPPS